MMARELEVVRLMHGPTIVGAKKKAFILLSTVPVTALRKSL